MTSKHHQFQYLFKVFFGIYMIFIASPLWAEIEQEQAIQAPVNQLHETLISIMESAKIVKTVVQEEFPEKGDTSVVTTPSNDNRSYRINSDKIAAKLGFQPKGTIEDAVRDLCRAFKASKLPGSMTDDRYYNVKVLKRTRAT